jgi:hypothetical protein
MTDITVRINSFAPGVAESLAFTMNARGVNKGGDKVILAHIAKMLEASNESARL